MKPFIFISLAMVSGSALAQSTISSTNRYAYAANAGWIDFNLSSTPGSGVVVTDTFLSGYAYAANFGYIHFGNGAPTNGHTYTNNSATNYGVNVALDGQLTGYAYAANIGWIQFEQTFGQPKLNLLTGIFTGHAYSANLGWIALNTTLSTLATVTINRPDADSDGIPDPWERLFFGNLTRATSTTDKDGDGVIDRLEYFAGTDPGNAASLLKITAQSYNPALTQATLTWTIVPTRNYRVEHDSDLLGIWTDATGSFTPAAGVIATRTINFTTSPKKFFRIAAVLPLP